MSATQISAYISEATKEQLELYVKRRGVKKGFLIEEALQHYLKALREIPEDVIIPTRIVVTDETMERIAALLESDAEPTNELKALMHE